MEVFTNITYFSNAFLFKIKFIIIPDDIVHKSVQQTLDQNFLVIAMVKLVEGDGDKH